MLSHLSCVQLFVTLWTTAHQAPPSIGFSRQEYWSRLPCPLPGDLPDLGIELTSLMSPTLAGGFFTTNATWEALWIINRKLKKIPFKMHQNKTFRNKFNKKCAPDLFVLSSIKNHQDLVRTKTSKQWKFVKTNYTQGFSMPTTNSITHSSNGESLTLSGQRCA